MLDCKFARPFANHAALNDQGLGAVDAHRFEVGLPRCRRPPHDRLDLKADAARGSAYLRNVWRAEWIDLVGKNCHASHRREQLMDQLDRLASHFGHSARYAGDVTARAGEA